MLTIDKMLKSNGNILIICKNEVRLGEIRAQLAPHFNVFTATDSRTAYRTLTEFDMHVVLSSERMEDMTGIQFFESVRPEFPHLISIIQASTSDISVLKQASSAEKIDKYLRVDVGFEEMFQSVRSAIKRAELLSENLELSKQLKKKTDEQERVMDLFKKYVPEQVVSQTLRYENNDILQGETRIISVLFADIRNFTRLSANVNPSEVVSFLNDFWSALGEPVKMNHGSVNKLIGDGMLALFGAPVSHIHNQKNAVNCALDMVRALDKVNEKYQPIFDSEIKIGVGINTGEVLVGNIGTEDHMEYTVIGDAVNTASRIESKTKSKPNSIMISGATYSFVEDEIDATEVDPLIMDGKSEPIKLFEVHGKNQINIKPIRKGFSS